jgi:predicted O-linked N-acetylglucosamine transferase (SPINDLY family)
MLPGQAEACCDLASVLLAQREWDAAASLLGPLVAREPGNARAGLLLGKALLGAGRTLEAATLLLARAGNLPLDAELAYQTGRALDQLAQLPDAIQWFTKAAALAPERADIRNALAVAYFNAGSHPPALEQFRQALALKSDYLDAHSNLLMALHYPWPVDLELIFAEHVRWAKQHTGGLGKSGGSFVIRRAPQRRLNIAYLSPRFCAGALASFFMPVLGSHDRERFNITCYSLAPNDDAITTRMRERAEQWRECADMDDEALLNLIRNDAIDIVVDLVGHSPGNRLHALSERAAPLQMTWLDYVDTTGLAAMDYFISDRYHTPLESRQRFVEELIRLPDVRLCYQPQDPLPNLRQPRTQKTGAFTFGSFNRISKYSDAVIDAWSKILEGTPGSRLILKATALSNEQTRELTRRRFAGHGIASSRLDLRPFSDSRQMMHEYNDVDIVLDPFPFNGGTTTCDALSMGRPVVTLEGVNVASRQGVAFLNVCGMSRWVMKSVDDYVRLAIELAADAPDPTRANEVRDRFLASPICDAPRFTRNLEAAYVTAWQRRLDLDR